MENRRVVITGTGVVTPVGNNVETFWNNIINGVCGIDFIKSIPTDNLSVKIAGELSRTIILTPSLEPPSSL